MNEQEKTIYGEIDTGEDEPLKPTFPHPPLSVNTEDDDCEIIIPDDGDTTDAYLPMTEIFSYSEQEKLAKEETSASEDDPTSYDRSIRRNPSHKITEDRPSPVGISYADITAIKDEPLEDSSMFQNPFSNQGKRSRGNDEPTSTTYKSRRINPKVETFVECTPSISVEDNIVVKQEPLDLIDDDDDGERNDLISEPLHPYNAGAEFPIDIKAEIPEEENYTFSNEFEDGFFDEGEGNVSDEDVKDESFFNDSKSFFDTYGEDDPGQKSDYSYQPSDEEAVDDYDYPHDKKNKSHVKKPTNIVCPICGKLSKWHKTHINHMKQYHPDHPMVKTSMKIDEVKLINSKDEMLQLLTPMRRTVCPICQRVGFKGYVSYNDHINGHRNIRSYICACSSAFTTRHNFVSHRRYCKKPIEECKIPSYAEESFLDAFKKKSRPSQIVHDPPLKDRACPHCGKKGYHFMIHFMDHQNSHTNERPYKCGCAFTANSLASFTTHLKRFRCSIDSTEWPDYAKEYRKNADQKLRALESISSRPPEKVVKLEVVDNFRSVVPRTERQSIHLPQRKPRNKRNFPIPDRILENGKKLYTCWECDFKSYKTTLVYNHYEARHVEKTIKCTACDKLYPSERSLRKHYRQMHEQTVQCEECDEVLPRIRLKQHRNFKHLKPFSCEECSESFGRQSNLDIHKNRNHNVVACILCEALCNVKKSSFQNHISSPEHRFYESNWFKFNNIQKIPCDTCDWQSGSFQEIFKHFKTQHKLSVEKVLLYLKTFGSQDPELLQTLRAERGVSYASGATEKTCFICFQLIPLAHKSPDTNLVFHLNGSPEHQIATEQWKELHGIDYFPCADCDCKTNFTLQAAVFPLQ